MGITDYVGLVVAETVGSAAARSDGYDMYWIELRPGEGGRSTLVRRTRAGKISDATLKEFTSARAVKVENLQDD